MKEGLVKFDKKISLNIWYFVEGNIIRFGSRYGKKGILFRVWEEKIRR